MNRESIYPLRVVILLLLALSILILDDLADGDWGRLTGGWGNLVTFWNESLWPPDWSVLEAQSYPQCESEVGFFCSKAYLGMVETLKIAFVSTILGFALVIGFSPLAARNLTRPSIAIPIRIFLSALRSLPSLIWAIIFVIVIGFGPLSGVLAMTIYTVGYLGKLQYEHMEGLQNDPLEAARAMGLSHFEISTHIVIPESANSLLSQMMFMFEYNVRHGTVIGIVGAGGIGYYINTYMKFLYYDKVLALLIVIFVVVLAIDLLSMFIRSFVTEEGDVKRPSWSTILFSPNRAATHHHGEDKEAENTSDQH